MNTKVQEIETAFQTYKTLQERHIKDIGKKDMDLDMLLFERNRAFEDLRIYLSAIPGIFKTNTFPMADICRRNLAEILENDRIMADKIKTYKDKLSKAINDSKNGKKALKGYQGSSTDSLRFIKTSG